MTKADVDFKQKQAVVTYDSDKTSPEKVAEGLKSETDGRYTATVK